MNPLRVLIVEDERIIALALQQLLTEQGYVVVGRVGSGEDALAHVRENPVDLVLMDIHLERKLDGIEAAGLIYRQYRLPVIFLTAYADEETLRRAEACSPFGYLIKPIDARELNAAIRMAMSRHMAEVAIEKSACKSRWTPPA